MSPEEKQLLERVAVLSEENNHILRGMRRANRLGVIWKVLYWGAIIAISYGAYVYVQPYIKLLTQEYAKIQGTVNSVQKTASQIPDLGKLLNDLVK